MKLIALRISQNGRPGTVFEREGEVARHLIAQGIAAEYDVEKAEAEKVAAEKAAAEKAEAEKVAADDKLQPAPDPDGLDEFAETVAPQNKGGKNVKNANKKAETK